MNADAGRAVAFFDAPASGNTTAHPEP
jgi:hypothetical protein